MANLQFASLNCHRLNSAVASYIRSSLAFADCVLRLPSQLQKAQAKIDSRQIATAAEATAAMCSRSTAGNAAR